MPEAPVHAPKGDIKLPGLGPVPKKWFIIVGGGTVVVIGYVLYKKKSGASSAAATPAAADTGTSALSGQPCVDENGNPGVYDDTGTCQVDTSALGGYYSGDGAAGVSGTTEPVAGTGGFVTNGQWTQQVETDVQSLGTGIDPGTLSTALGAYIAGQPVTAAQQSLIDQAISIDGYPPVAGANGYPPAIMVQPVTTTTGTTTGTGTTTTTTASTTLPAPGGLRASAISDSGYSLNWDAVTGAKGYTVATYDSKGAEVDEFTVTGTATKEYGRGGKGLTPKATYHSNVWANGGTGSPPHATVSVTLL